MSRSRNRNVTCPPINLKPFLTAAVVEATPAARVDASLTSTNCFLEHARVLLERTLYLLT
jgi:hypothetical protein